MEGQDDRPSNTQIDFFEQAIAAHDKVSDLSALGPQVFRITRVGDMSDVTIYLTNLYTVGYADVVGILSERPEVDCIVTASTWNGYTDGAKLYAKQRRVGLFEFKELMGALNWRRFWTYEKRSRK